MAFDQLAYGNLYTFIDTALTSLVGAAFAMPLGAANVITWHNVSTGGASASSVVLQASLDGINFTTVDTSVSLTGEIRTISFNAVRFIRAVVNSRTGGTVNKVMVCVGK